MQTVCGLLAPSRLMLVPVVVLVLGLAPAQPLAAGEIRENKTEVLVKSDETIADNLYAFSEKVTIDGTIQGNLIAFGKDVVINGTVEGDVIAIGQQIQINGTVKGDVMGAGQAVVLTGSADDARIAGQVLKLGPKAKLGGSVLAAGFSLETDKDSTIAGDALFGGFQALLGGQIDKDLKAGLVNCRMAGKVGGNIDLQVDGDEQSATPPFMGPAPPLPLPTIPGGLTIADTAEVTGKMYYVAKHEAKVPEGAKLTGGVEYSRPAAPKAKPGQPAPPPPNAVLSAVLTHLRHGLCVALVGIAAVVFFPRWTSDWADNIRTRPGASFLGGLAGMAAFVGLLFLVVVVIALAAIVAGYLLEELVPMIIVGGAIGYAAMIVLIWLIAQFLGEALAGLAVGRLAMRTDTLPVRAAAMVLGIVVVTLILSIPYAGPWLGFVVFLFSLGGFCLWLVGYVPADQIPSYGPGPAAKKA